MLVVVLLTTALPVLAQPPSTAPPPISEITDEVVLGFTGHEFTIGGRGREGSIDWLRTSASKSRFLLGARVASFEKTRWSFGRIGVAVAPASRLTLYTEANIGSGKRDREQHFSYALGRGSLTLEVVRKKFFVEVEDQYVDIDTAKGNIAKGGVILIPAQPLTITLAYYDSVSGNINARYGVGRVDLMAGRTKLLAGYSRGRTRPELFQVFNLPSARKSNEIFAGIEVPMGRQRLILAGASLEFEDVKRRSLLLSWRIPF